MCRMQVNVVCDLFKQLHEFVVACVACNKILVANNNCKTQNLFLLMKQA